LKENYEITLLSSLTLAFLVENHILSDLKLIGLIERNDGLERYVQTNCNDSKIFGSNMAEKIEQTYDFFEMMARNEDALYTKFKKEILQKLDVIDKDSEILG
jgi:hypothetical protein